MNETNALVCHEVDIKFTSPEVGPGSTSFGDGLDEDQYSEECDALNHALSAVLDEFVLRCQIRWPGLGWQPGSLQGDALVPTVGPEHGREDG